MTYQATDESAQDAQPVYKFLFATQTAEYMYTTAGYFISDSTGTWEPAPIRASSVTQNNELAKNGVKITLPRTNAVAQLFLGKVPEDTTSVTIYRGFQETDLDEFQVFWKGRVASAEASQDAVTLECEDIFTSMRRPGNRARYQKGCRHALYSPQCGVSDHEYAVDATITAQSGFTITVDFTLDSVGSGDSNSLVSEDDYFLGGVVELGDGSRRAVVGQTQTGSGAILTLISQFTTIEIDSVSAFATLYPGCRHNTSDCKNKFNNLENYGGFPWLPSKNPFANSVNGSIV
jgi:hypothetical protein